MIISILNDTSVWLWAALFLQIWDAAAEPEHPAFVNWGLLCRRHQNPFEDLLLKVAVFTQSLTTAFLQRCINQLAPWKVWVKKITENQLQLQRKQDPMSSKVRGLDLNCLQQHHPKNIWILIRSKWRYRQIFLADERTKGRANEGVPWGLRGLPLVQYVTMKCEEKFKLI